MNRVFPIYCDDDTTNVDIRKLLYDLKRNILLNMAEPTNHLENPDMGSYPKLKRTSHTLSTRWCLMKNYFEELRPDDVLSFIHNTLSFKFKKYKYLPSFIGVSRDGMLLQVTTTSLPISLREITQDRHLM